MDLTRKIQKTVSVRFLRARCGVRYWEDATVNGEEDADGSRIPCRTGEDWTPTIDLETGIIQSWPAGVTADIHYKVCDDGDYHLLDEHFNVVASIDGYVPKIMCPEENGFGDYVIMKIDGQGRVANWKPDLSAFSEDEG